MPRRLPLAVALSCAAAPAFAVSFTLTDLGDLRGGDFGRAYGINDAGQVVGSSGAATGSRAFLWEGGTMTDLGDLPGGGDVSRAYGINEAGQVVGNSQVASTGPCAFLWDSGTMTDLNTLIDPGLG